MALNNSGKLIAIALAIPLMASANAQEDLRFAIEKGTGYQGVRMDTVHGTVTVVLPTLLQVGDTISGTVLVSPSGKSEKERGQHQKALAELSFMALGAQLKGVPGSFKAQVPAEGLVGPGSASPSPTQRPISTLPRLGLFKQDHLSAPSVVAQGEPILIPGSFDGDSANTKVTMGGKPGVVLAETPDSLIFMPADLKPGPWKIVVGEKERIETAQTNLAAFKMMLPRTTIMAGERIILTCEVSGLKGLMDKQFPIQAWLRNESPQIVQMQGGEAQTKAIQPKDSDKNGIVTWSVPLNGLMQGGFTLRGGLASPNFPWPNWRLPDLDRPIPMDGNETAAELDGYTIRRLMDTLRELRARKAWDLVHGVEHQEFLAKCIAKIKAALGRKGVDVPDLPGDE